jgi:hypothetical protein
MTAKRRPRLTGGGYRWFRICNLAGAQLRCSGRELPGWLLLTPIAGEMRSDLGEAHFNRANCPTAEFRDETPYSGTSFRVGLGLRLKWARDRREATLDSRRGSSGPGLYVLNLGF